MKLQKSQEIKEISRNYRNFKKLQKFEEITEIVRNYRNHKKLHKSQISKTGTVTTVLR